MDSIELMPMLGYVVQRISLDEGVAAIPELGFNVEFSYDDPSYIVWQDVISKENQDI